MSNLHKILLALALIASTACSSDKGTGPTPEPTPGPTRLVVTAGDNQTGTAGVPELASALGVFVGTEKSTGTVRAQRVALDVAPTDTVITNLTPLPNQVLSWRVVEQPSALSTCGEPFASAILTDSSGVARNRWINMTRAGTCHMVVVAVDQATGQGIVYDTLSATVLPAAAEYLSFDNSTATVNVGGSVDLRARMVGGRDRYENFITPEQMSAPGYALRRVGETSPTAPTGTGWTVTIPDADVLGVYIFVGNATSDFNVTVTP